MKIRYLAVVACAAGLGWAAHAVASDQDQAMVDTVKTVVIKSGLVELTAEEAG